MQPRNATVGRARRRWSLAVLVLLLAGCGDEATRTPSTSDCLQAFPAVAVELQPSFTRLVPPTADQPGRLEARVVLKDRFGDRVKALAEFRFELFRYRPAFSDPRGQRFEQGGIQTFDLASVTANQGRWDSITRGYPLQLPLPDEIANQKRIAVQVTATTDCGQRLVDVLVIERP